MSKATEKVIEAHVLPRATYPPIDNSAQITVQVLNICPRRRRAVRGIIHEVRFAMDYGSATCHGMTIETDLSLCGLAGVDCGLAAYFSFWDGTPLNDFNNSYRCYDGTVCVGVELTPSRREQFFPSIQLFMPYSELHLASGSHELALLLRAYRRATNRTLDQTERFRWSFTQP